MTQVSNKIKKGTDGCPIVKVKKKIKTIPTSLPIQYHITLQSPYHLYFSFIFFYLLIENCTEEELAELSSFPFFVHFILCHFQRSGPCLSILSFFLFCLACTPTAVSEWGDVSRRVAVRQLLLCEEAFVITRRWGSSIPVLLHSKCMRHGRSMQLPFFMFHQIDAVVDVVAALVAAEVA